MGCNCGGRKSGTTTASATGSTALIKGGWVFVQPDGSKLYFNDQRSAKAHLIRSGGRGLVRRA